MEIIKPAYAATTDIYQEFGLAMPDIGTFVKLLTPLAFSIAAMFVVFHFIIASFELITSQGDKAHIVSARSKIYHAMIGFILLIFIFLIMQYLIPALGIVNFKIF